VESFGREEVKPEEGVMRKKKIRRATNRARSRMNLRVEQKRVMVLPRVQSSSMEGTDSIIVSVKIFLFFNS
jgi:hypothetical protein